MSIEMHLRRHLLTAFQYPSAAALGTALHIPPIRDLIMMAGGVDVPSGLRVYSNILSFHIL